MLYLFVGLAGALGSMLRYGVGILLFPADAVFPFSTLTVNLIGSFLLAWLTKHLFTNLNIPTTAKTAIGTGFVASFTTFSTLSVETIELVENGMLILASLYILVSILGGLSMSMLGFHTAERRKKK
ncbi:CrcB protein [Sediminibacillus albus]|uniref:Fluoride-specific ion channel FluC n=2 Tax=Sediminibacillus albus TaxID=407036 RepID=A0A1G8YV39_9BACI|nr:CrcB protein [Sediminibacillus albus]